MTYGERFPDGTTVIVPEYLTGCYPAVKWGDDGEPVRKPRLLDLFCGAGGCSVGYARAGFDVTGVDIEPHKDYPFPMIVGDAMTILDCPAILKAFDVIHASPPCQAYANVTSWRGDQDNHPDLLPEVRSALTAWGETWGGQWVIENVPEAPIRRDYLLCGSMFGLRVRRHRAFETSAGAPSELIHPCDHRNLLPFEHKAERAYADAMGCDWMSAKEARESIPPAYTEHIGRQLLDNFGDRSDMRCGVHQVAWTFDGCPVMT